MIEVLRLSYIETQKDLQFYRAKIQDANKKKQQIRQDLNDTRKKLAKERDKQRKDQWQRMKQRLEQELKKLDNTSKDLNFKLQMAMSKFSQAQQAMAQVAKKSHDTQKKVIENMK
jgi:predicted  nucleic acid-binding Zn-ribbon protein